MSAITWQELVKSRCGMADLGGWRQALEDCFGEMISDYEIKPAAVLMCERARKHAYKRGNSERLPNANDLISCIIALRGEAKKAQEPPSTRWKVNWDEIIDDELAFIDRHIADGFRAEHVNADVAAFVYRFEKPEWRERGISEAHIYRMERHIAEHYPWLDLRAGREEIMRIKQAEQAQKCT